MTEQKYEGFEEPKANFTRIPNGFLEAMPLIETLGEMKVIYYILRHTWGFQDDQKRITQDEFENGRKRQDGSRMDGGTGLSGPTIRDGLARAERHGFINVEIDDRDKARIKKYYSLNMREQGERNLPPESDGQGERNLPPKGKKFTPKGKEIYPRSEKDTVERHPEKEIIGRKPDVLDAMLRFGVRSGENYADPARDWDEAVDAFAGLVGVDPMLLPETSRREWARVLREEVGAIWGVGSGTVAEVIRKVPESEFHWKTWSSPHGAKADLGTLVGQHLSGGIKGPKPKGNGGKLSFSEQRRRFLEQVEEGVALDAPAWTVGEVL